MTAKSTEQIDFGFQPFETQHHFLLHLPRSKKDDVIVLERFSWDPLDKDNKELHLSEDSNIKVKISREKWEHIQVFIEKAFNARLKKLKLRAGKLQSGNIIFERLLGKELMVLLWAIEDAESRLIPTAIQSWENLTKEERWWLFTITNASSGYYRRKSGWRIALRYALTDSKSRADKPIQGFLF